MKDRKEFNSFDSEQRRKYKYACLRPYFKLLPPGVIETMLDLDLFERDEAGNIIQSVYETRIQTGEVNELISKVKTPFENN